MKRVTVLVVDDHAIVREGLRLILQTFDEVDVVGEAADGAQAVRETQRLRPDVVLMDLSMTVLNGVEVTRQITMERPGARVIVLSTYSDVEHVEQALGAGWPREQYVHGRLHPHPAGDRRCRGARQIDSGAQGTVMG